MFSKIILALWSCAGLIWWLVAWRLAASDSKRSSVAIGSPTRRTLSVFKPLPPLGATGLNRVTEGLESFVAQLDSRSEMLLGVHEEDRDTIAPFLQRMHAEYPAARIKSVFRDEVDGGGNPKIAWQRILALEADGELWLWSDADITAPSGFLQSAQAQFEKFARNGVGLMTFPYVIRQIPAPFALLEALFINVEFYPGVLFLRDQGLVDFGLGAAMLFRREDFMQKVVWREIGGQLADDFFLGQKLQPVRIGSSTLATVAGASTWKEAFAHDLRWSKTIRWSRPMGSFARILIMPVLGWLAAVALYPAHFLAWVGLLGMVQAEILFAAAICHRVGCRLKWENVPGLAMWSLWRVFLWFLCWLPLPVSWSGKIWSSPRVELNREINLSSTYVSR